MKNKLDKNYMPITDKYFYNELVESKNNNTIEKIFSTIKTLSDENRINWKRMTKSHIHYAEYIACAELDTLLRWFKGWVLSLEKEIIKNLDDIVIDIEDSINDNL